MTVEKNRLEKEMEALCRRLEELPEGKLVYASNGKYKKWYQSDGHNKKYIPKSNKKLAEQLAEKKYLLSLLEDLSIEKKRIESYLRYRHSDLDKTKEMLVDMPEYQELLAPYFIPKTEELNNWVKAPYEKNLKNPEHLIHKGSSGIMLRSKSEAIIEMLLYMNRIPFRYECALHLKDVTIFPDFTLRHPRTGQIYYWEHFGLMDDPAYAKNTSKKLGTYIANNILPTIHLITTYETKEHPLGMDTVKDIIERYFL